MHTAGYAITPTCPAGRATMNDIIDRWRAMDGTSLAMREMRPSDEARVKESLNKLSADARRNRFFVSIAEFSDAAVHRLVAIDPAREYLLVVLRRENDIDIPIAGGRFVHEDERPDCAFSLLVGDPWQGQGIGRRILKALIREASRRGLRRMYGHVLADNPRMLELARAQRFTIVESGQDKGVVLVDRQLPGRASQRWKDLVRCLWRR